MNLGLVSTVTKFLPVCAREAGRTSSLRLGSREEHQHAQEHQKHAEGSHAKDIFHAHGAVHIGSNEGPRRASDVHQCVVMEEPMAAHFPWTRVPVVPTTVGFTRAMPKAGSASTKATSTPRGNGITAIARLRRASPAGNKRSRGSNRRVRGRAGNPCGPQVRLRRPAGGPVRRRIR